MYNDSHQNKKEFNKMKTVAEIEEITINNRLMVDALVEYLAKDAEEIDEFATNLSIEVDDDSELDAILNEELG